MVQSVLEYVLESIRVYKGYACKGYGKHFYMLEEVFSYILVWISAIYFSTLCTLLVATKLPLQSNWLL